MDQLKGHRVKLIVNQGQVLMYRIKISSSKYDLIDIRDLFFDQDLICGSN